MNTLGKRLAEFRRAAHMTQSSLAQASGLSRSSIAGLELGYIKGARLTTIERLANALDIPVEFFFAKIPLTLPAEKARDTAA